MLVLLIFGNIHLWSHLVQDFLFAGNFFITVLISLAVIVLLRFSGFFNLERLFFSRNLSISSRLCNFLVYNYSQYFLIILSISVVSVVTSSLSCQILFIWILSSWWISFKVYQSCLFIQRTSSWFYWCFVVLDFILFIFSLIF